MTSWSTEFSMPEIPAAFLFAITITAYITADNKPKRMPAVFAPPPKQEEPVAPRADELAQRFVETARTRYTEAQSTAAYRPVSEEVKPYTPHPQQKAQAAAPRVFDYKKQPKPQSAKKQPVTRVQKGAPGADDEE